LAVDGAGNLFIADQGNNRVRRVDASGVITTVAGNGKGREAGRPATTVKLSAPEALAFDRGGNLYVSEYDGDQVVRITPRGRLTVVAGTGVRGSSGDGGPATAAQLAGPTGLAFDARGALLISDHLNSVIRKVAPDGRITTLASSVKARLFKPNDVVFRGKDLYVADLGRARIVKLGPSGSVSVVARGVHPSYLSLDTGRNLDFSDRTANRLYRIPIAANGRPGEASLIAGTTSGYGGDGGPAGRARLNGPYGIAVDRRGDLYVSDRFNNRVRRIDRRGIITTVAGTGAPGFAGDGGPAKAAKLNSPVGLAFDAAGTLYIADQGNGRVRRVDRHGVISTFAGRS
jgi:sugar lactone lactonase YvrE